jgi:hypothetical protein
VKACAGTWHSFRPAHAFAIAISILFEAVMKHTIITLLVAAGMAASVGAESPQQAFVKAWKGQAVVVKSELYSLVYNERGLLGTTKSGRREGLLVVTSSQRGYLQFDGRQGRETVVAYDPTELVNAVSTAYQPDNLDVRQYRKLEPVAIERFVAGAELVVTNVRIERDEVRLELELPDGNKDSSTSLRVKWPLPLSPSFSERVELEGLLRQFVEIKRS